MRIGHGFDVHQFERDKPLILCGVLIPYEFGLKAHSDGDVAIHALCDAMLGALALGDIGQHFPDTEDQNKNRPSQEFLLEINKLLAKQQYQISNLDLTIVLQLPKLAPFISKMKTKLASILSLNEYQVNIKATTTEYLGYIGRKEGIAAHAVVLLNKINI